MGHSSRKKKKSGSGSGRRNRSKDPSKDHYSQPGEDNDPSEELTALGSIYQEDIKVVSEATHTKLIINIRPYWSDMRIEEFDLSALLLVRLLPGYPHKCPKLQIVPEKGLSKKDADRLLSLLVDQANIYSREGRVMIYDLVEAAQQFLSEIAPVEQIFDSVSYLGSIGKDQHVKEDSLVVGGCKSYSDGPFVCGSIDLYSDLCSDEMSWGCLGTRVANDNSGKPSEGQAGPFIKTRTRGLASAKNERNSVKHSLQNEQPEVYHTKYCAFQHEPAILHISEEENEKQTDIDDNRNLQNTSERPQVLESAEKDFENIENDDLELLMKEDSDDLDLDEKSCNSYSSAGKQESESHRRKRDLLMVHLLHLACSSGGALSHDLPLISSELYNLGMISDWAKDLSNGSPSTFSKVFSHAFEHHLNASRISEFWKPANIFSGDNVSSLMNSRYLNDFEEIHSLGRGGFGHVVLCKNKLDGRHYAVKKIRLKDRNPHVNDKILREVATLSRLQHQHVVRYYQAWVETVHGETTCGSRIVGSFSGSFLDSSFTRASSPDNRLESTYLYIQMEYCPRTLRQDFETCTSFDKDYTWHLFRQIVEGLAHIHSLGIIHRDLTPSNIFFDARNDIKIGDFGLAKFLNLDQLDHDQYLPDETNGVSMDGTGQVGTYFYTAPEIEQRWPQINEKVDMYSLGVVFFELWHRFATTMERHITLTDLKQKGVLPNHWIAKFPKQSAILQRLMSPGPADRPSATDLLHNDLPPRKEDEWLNDILRALQSSEDSYIYDRVVSSIFDLERLEMKAPHLHGGSLKLVKDAPTFLQYAEADTELQDSAIEITKEVFSQHGARRLEISPMRIIDEVLSFFLALRRNTVKLLTSGGDMLELCHELRTPFVNWVVANQVFSFKRYEVNRVYRRAVGHSTPNRFYQGDFDIIGGSPPLLEAEAVKVVVDIVSRFCHPSMIDIRLNHMQVLEAVWSWAGVSKELRQNVAELLSLIGSSPPHSTKRKSNWGFIRRQLMQDLHLSEVIVNRLQTADLRFCGSADKALARLRGALSPDKITRKALEEISTLVSYLRIWNIEKNISLDVLIPPTEEYYRELYFQVFLKDHMQVPVSEATLIAVGGRYDYLVHQKWNHENRSNPPGAVGTSLALEKVFRHCLMDIKPFRIEVNTNVLVCSKGGGGLLLERMELVAELWQANMKAEFVLLPDPSLTEQYEYAAEHDIKCLIIITETGLSQTGLIKTLDEETNRSWDLLYLTCILAFRILSMLIDLTVVS
ncbi:eIF-2-alpha kinase GCN2 isoform X2 [Phalaenopsis equestris]|uniref:eIF-2-alpha kinase GCN2 isoform X2 n=1 Tax=Phalaenopsis equestris TaxID=78828 RepID=UPI0009E4C15B|nr:eIF-2-alpha kinase GCN2 isoform X2 [Phalaenopsis equestris]